MNNNLLVSAAVSVVPILVIGFVGVLILQKLYVKIRSRYSANVNCWFCNLNARVPYLAKNSWTCPHCEQYNGFNKDGDYNREIFQQLDCSNISDGRDPLDDSGDCYAPPRNGFCNACNEAQRLKVEKLAQFEPKSESHFDEELKVYKAKLEDLYRLCFTCDRHLSKVLREKKKMVLGSKFLDYIIKGADRLKQPHLTQLRQAQQQHLKRRLVYLIVLLAALNVFCLCNRVLVTLTREQLTVPLGETVGHHLFIALSHLLAFGRAIYACVDALAQHESLQKCWLFMRTLSLMLLYSLGLKLPQLVRVNFAAVYLLSSPFIILAASFAYSVVDSFRLTQCTFLLVLWSALAGGLIGDQFFISQNAWILLASVLTVALLLLCHADTWAKLHDTSAKSFHKIYSEDYLSDEDTISLLSQQLNSSAASASMRSSRYSNSPPRPPQSVSVLSLNNGIGAHRQPTRSVFSPNSSFKTFCLNGDSQRSPYAASMCNFSTVAAPTAGGRLNRNHTSNSVASLFASNLELNRQERMRPSSTVFGQYGSHAAPYNGNTSFTESRSHHHSLLQPVTAGNDGGHSSSERLLFGTPASMAMDVGFASVAASPLHSPFSLSNNAVYHQKPLNVRTATPGANLLSPSRFSTSALNTHNGNGGGGGGPSWLSCGLFNQYQQQQQQQQQKRFLLDPNRNGMSAIDENLSRASSQSSGFESQNAEAPLDSNQTASAFQPIEPRLPCANIATAASPFDGWNAPPARKALHTHLGGRDSFNLRRINDELPSIRRGDLLRKWKESEAAA